MNGKIINEIHLYLDQDKEHDLKMKIKILKESIKCHHNEFTEYIQNKMK